MTAAEVQAMTARLFVDRAFREWFRHAPDDASGGYLLSAEEVNMVRAVDAERLETYADSLRLRRRRALATAYPLSRMVAREEFDRYSDRYCDLRPGIPERERLLGFGDYLKQCLEAETGIPPFGGDLAIYERHLIDLRSLEAAWFPANQGNSSNIVGGPDAVNSGDSRPQLSSRPRIAAWARVDVFGYDIPSIVADLERTGMPSTPRPAPTGIFMRRVAQSAALEIFRIESRVAAMLRRFTGELTVAAVAEQCRFNPEQLVALLASLDAMRVIAC